MDTETMSNAVILHTGKRFVVACWLLLVSLPVTSLAAESILQVSSDGDAEYHSVQQAVDAAAPGATVEIAEGTYRENIVIGKPLTLRGAGIGKTIIELPGDVGPTVEAFWEQILEKMEKMSIQELKESHALWRGKPSSVPFVIRGDHEVRVEGIQFVWVGPKSTNPTVIECLADITGADVTLNRVAFLGSPDDGVHIRAGARCEMTGCLVAGNWGRGVQIGVKNEPPGRVRIAECEIRNNHRSHIVVYYDAEEIRIERNLLHGSAWFGIRPSGKNKVIVGNAIFDNARSGLYCVGSSNQVTGNLFFGNGFGGISCWSGNRDTITGNTFVRNGREESNGVKCIGDAKPLIRDNIFVGHTHGIQARYSGADDRTAAAIGQPEIGRNLYWENETNIVRLEPIRDREEGSVETEITPEPEMVAEFDPGFRNAAERDYSLREDSRARIEKLGAQDVVDLAARFPLHSTEKAIVPDGDGWDYKLWKKPPEPNAEEFQRRAFALFERKQAEALRPDVSYVDAFRDLHATLGKSYPNFELKRIDWNAVGQELIPRAEKLTSDRDFGLLCYELVARLEDSHAYVHKGLISPPTVEFPRWDPGLACLLDDRGKPVVYYIDHGGPADDAGLTVGMTVVSINGRAAEDLIDETMAQTRRFWGYSSERYLRYQAARWFVRQMQEGAPMQVVAKDVDGADRTFELKATMGVRYLPRRPVKLEGIRDSANVDWTMLDGNFGLIYVRRIRGDLIEQLDKAVAELKDADGMIIDVRGNSGGGFDFQRAHLNFTDDRSQEPDRPRFTGPVALLIDSRCISAGEGWASWFIANNRARVFGTATAGASSRKTTYELSNKLFKVTFPVKPYKGYLDRTIERRGLEPDVEVRQNARDLASGKDTVLEAAIAWLKSRAESTR